MTGAVGVVGRPRRPWLGRGIGKQAWMGKADGKPPRGNHNKSLELSPKRPGDAVDAVCRGSLRAGDAAAQLNSMLRTLGSQNSGYDLLAQTGRGSYSGIPWGRSKKEPSRGCCCFRGEQAATGELRQAGRVRLANSVIQAPAPQTQCA